nr:hypothetical protein [Tanacetum cinerariifolium]
MLLAEYYIVFKTTKAIKGQALLGDLLIRPSWLAILVRDQEQDNKRAYLYSLLLDQEHKFKDNFNRWLPKETLIRSVLRMGGIYLIRIIKRGLHGVTTAQLVLLVYKVVDVFNKVNAAKLRVTTAVRVSTAGWIKWLEEQDMQVNEIY